MAGNGIAKLRRVFYRLLTYH